MERGWFRTRWADGAGGDAVRAPPAAAAAAAAVPPGCSQGGALSRQPSCISAARCIPPSPTPPTAPGEKAGTMSELKDGSVRLRAPEPSAAAVHTAKAPSAPPQDQARRRPSGDQDGCALMPPVLLTWSGPEPSGFTVQISKAPVKLAAVARRPLAARAAGRGGGGGQGWAAAAATAAVMCAVDVRKLSSANELAHQWQLSQPCGRVHRASSGGGGGGAGRSNGQPRPSVPALTWGSCARVLNARQQEQGQPRGPHAAQVCRHPPSLHQTPLQRVVQSGC